MGDVIKNNSKVSTHSRLKAAGDYQVEAIHHAIVSTHSRLKAAGFFQFFYFCRNSSFNTQPPEGGWGLKAATVASG